MQDQDLSVLLRSRVPLIAVESCDETRALQALQRACAELPAPNRSLQPGPVAGAAAGGMPLFRWTVTDGLKRLDVDMGPPQRTIAEPVDILKHIRATNLAGTYALLDFHPYLKDPTLVRLLKDIAAGGDTQGDTTTLEDLGVLAKLRANDEE